MCWSCVVFVARLSVVHPVPILSSRRPSGDRRLALAILQPQSGPVCRGRRLSPAGRRFDIATAAVTDP